MIAISPAFSATYPGACAGFLALSNVTNPEHSDALDQRKDAWRPICGRSWPDKTAAP